MDMVTNTSYNKYYGAPRSLRVFLLLSILFISLSGCFTNVAQREPLPNIIWPKPPDIPRIRFVNSISKPDDMNISEGAVKTIMNYLWGEKPSSIVSPHGIATDSEGRLYVVDSMMKMVIVYSSKENKHYSFPDDDTTLVLPIDVAVHSKGIIFVSDSQEAVVKVFEDHGKRYAGEIGRGFLQRPTGIAVNEETGELIVVDTLGSEILRYDIDTFQFKGRFGVEGKAQGMLHSPTNVTISSDGNIIVSDTLNFRIQVFSPDYTFQNAFGEPGNAPGYFSRPKGVASDSDGNIYVVDALFDNVQIFDRNGRHLMAFGGPGYEYGKFWLPSGIFIDSNDRIYVSDTFNKRVQVFQYMKGD